MEAGFSTSIAETRGTPTNTITKVNVALFKTLPICFIRFFYPSEILYTKKGEVSKRSMDLTNIEKLVQDNLFEHRYNGREIEGVIIENFDIDDKFIVSLRSQKLVHNQPYHEILITVELLTLKSLPQL